ncbi:MAG: MerR family transcriptional regulator [Paludibacteraceae bacterium]|nr:MerR family transcriptional regulator [Paludibacteraceae bacterium]MBR4840766.1 MerR family transcriptional regulator [Paludibacteraceae bacterium]
MAKKLYYKIGEVAEILEVTQSTLRYWEKEFPQAMPKKNNAGTRLYTEETLNELRVIKYLLKDKSLKIEGVRLKLKENKTGTAHNYEIIEKLKNIRTELLELRNCFNSIMENAEEE